MQLKLTKEIINERLKDRGIELIGEYINIKTHSLFRCANNHTWETTPHHVIRKTGCPKCSSTKLTKEMVNERIKHRGIEIIGEFTKATKKTLFCCMNNHTWEATPTQVIHQSGCPTCSSNKLTKKDINEKIKHRDIKLIGEYLGARTKTTFQCPKEHEWEAAPGSVTSGRGCPHCSKRFPLSKDIVNKRIKDKGFELISEYSGASARSLFKCSKGHTWETSPSSAMKCGCPHCKKVFPLTKKIVNERLIEKGIQLIGNYINTHSITSFRCSAGHEWEASAGNVMHKTGCPVCANNIKLTKDIVNKRIKDNGFELIGEYVNNSTKTLFRCSNNHEWETRPNDVFRGTGCLTCNGTLPLTKEIVNERIKDRGIELIGEYITSKTKSLFRCANNHTWKTAPDNVMCGSGCHKCAVSGFKPNIPAHVYLLNFGHFIKFGISNTLKVRLQSHKTKNGKFTVIKTKLFENGQDALDWENDIKKKYGGWYVSKDILPHGFTETLPIFFKETLITMLDN